MRSFVHLYCEKLLVARTRVQGVKSITLGWRCRPKAHSGGGIYHGG